MADPTTSTSEPKFKAGDKCKSAGLTVTIKCIKRENYHFRLGHCYEVETEDHKANFNVFEGSLAGVKEVRHPEAEQAPLPPDFQTQPTDANSQEDNKAQTGAQTNLPAPVSEVPGKPVQHPAATQQVAKK